MKNINMNKDNSYAVVNTQGMRTERLMGLFDMIFGAEESRTSDDFNEYIKENKDMLSNSIVEKYDALVECYPDITDGNTMFEWWSYIWYRDSWVQDAQENNKKFTFQREPATKKYIVNEIFKNER